MSPLRPSYSMKFNPTNVTSMGFHTFGKERKLVLRMKTGKRIEIEITKQNINLYTKRNDTKKQYNTAAL